jgi:hypothetical protein
VIRIVLVPPSLSLSLSALCGQLLVVGFDGTTLDAPLRKQLDAGERGGIILFRRNLTGDPADVRAITIAAADAR